MDNTITLRKIMPAETCSRLKALLEERGLKPKDVVNSLWLESVQSVYKWYATAKGKLTIMPSLSNLVQICYILGVRMEDILVCEDIVVQQQDEFLLN